MFDQEVDIYEGAIEAFLGTAARLVVPEELFVTAVFVIEVNAVLGGVDFGFGLWFVAVVVIFVRLVIGAVHGHGFSPVGEIVNNDRCEPRFVALGSRWQRWRSEAIPPGMSMSVRWRRMDLPVWMCFSAAFYSGIEPAVAGVLNEL